MVGLSSSFGTFGHLTCYDLRFPELYRRMAVMGAKIFLVPSAWPLPRIEAWVMLNRVRALENQVFRISSKCVGINRGGQFIGHSMIVDTWGTAIGSGGFDECNLQARIDRQKVAEARTVFLAFSDRILV